MLPGMELMAACTDLAVPAEVMQHVVRIESSFNPFAIGLVGARLARQPRNLGEAVATAQMLEREGYNFSLGIAQVNRHNLGSQGLDTYRDAFAVCPNVEAGSRILADCYGRSEGDWGKAFSCYYSGNFTTGFEHGYVQKVVASWHGSAGEEPRAIPLSDANSEPSRRVPVARPELALASLLERRTAAAGSPVAGDGASREAGAAGGAGRPDSSAARARMTAITAADAAPVVLRLVNDDPSAPQVAPGALERPSAVPPDARVERDAAFVF